MGDEKKSDDTARGGGAAVEGREFYVWQESPREAVREASPLASAEKEGGGGEDLRVRDVMRRSIATIDGSESVALAAKLMRLSDVGMLAVCERGRLVGVVTDRDLAMRSTAEERQPSQQLVSAVMSRSPVACAGDQPLPAALELMRARRIRRLLVVGPDGALQGVLSLGDLAAVGGREAGVAEALRGITEPHSVPKSDPSDGT